jgi:hypothetical protein
MNADPRATIWTLIAIAVVALIAYEVQSVGTVDGPPAAAVSTGPKRVQTVAMHADPATPGDAAPLAPTPEFADPALPKSSFTIRAFEPKRVQTVAIHADPATPGDATNRRMYRFASSGEIGASFTIGAFEPKRVQTVAIPAGRSAAGRSAPA